MNIFVLDYDPQIAATYHNDRHVVKMIVETAQMLCTAHWCCGNEAPYKKSYENHPCNKWVRESKNNYIWLTKLGFYLCKEYTRRYDRVHKTEEVILWAMNNVPDLPCVKMTTFALAMPDDCKTEDAVESYRTYYMKHKDHLAKWSERETPSWYSKLNIENLV
jgi:hypothetical protein